MSRRFGTKSFKICRCCNKWQCQCLIPRKSKSHPPFGSGVNLNKKIGLHPKFYTEISEAPAVGSYEPHSARSKRQAISWKKEVDNKEFSATMGGRFLAKYAIQRDLMRRGRGPGTHEISQWPNNVLESPCKSVRENAGFGTVPLFEPTYRSTTPGPGHTKSHGQCNFDKSRSKSFSCVPSFEFDGLRERFRGVLKPWSLPCNRYNAKHPDSLEARLEKVTGKRGPYDLFTGPRDESTIKGYFATPKSDDRGDWPKKIPGVVEKILHRSNYFKGRWTTCPRFPKKPVSRLMLTDIALCYKDPDHPGPNHYRPKSPRTSKNALNWPFDSCVEHARPVARAEIRPAPGRYRIKEKHRVKGHGWTCVFKSKVQRTAFTVSQTYESF